MSLLFSVVRVHLAEQNDPFGHTRPIGRRLSMADLDLGINLEWPYEDFNTSLKEQSFFNIPVCEPIRIRQVGEYNQGPFQKSA